MTYTLPYDLLTHGQRRQLQAQADEERRTTRDAVMYWLLNSGVNRKARREFAARTLLGSVFAQAALVGLLSCSRCGDRGCDYCRPTELEQRRLDELAAKRMDELGLDA